MMLDEYLNYLHEDHIREKAKMAHKLLKFAKEFTKNPLKKKKTLYTGLGGVGAAGAYGAAKADK